MAVAIASSGAPSVAAATTGHDANAAAASTAVDDGARSSRPSAYTASAASGTAG